ncbi:MAG: hypothetical protein Q7V02_08040 [Methylophilus sp.]|nr:hypothetical protein [Methylophilus sp.]
MLIKCRFGWLMILMLSFSAQAVTAAASLQSQFKVHSETRELGYHLGDIALQTVTVETPEGYVLDASSLPTVGKKTYFDLVKIETKQRRFNAYTQFTIDLHWQNFRSVQEVRSYKLAALSLQFVKDKRSIKVPVKAASIIVSPVIPTVLDGAHLKPRADAKPPVMGYMTEMVIFIISAALLLATLLYLAWQQDWLGFHAKRGKPFRLAYRQLRSLRNDMSESASFSAVKAIRNAFDSTMQSSMSSEQLPKLFKQHQSLAVLENEIRHFYQVSDVFLFSNQPLDMSVKQLMGFTKKLMQLEQR